MNKSPVKSYDTSDPGDDMQLRIRYQHGYGLVLFCAAFNEKISCKSLWFEQLEDILLERSDGKFSFYQVKTREKTLGKWKITDEALVKSIKRFCEFEKDYGSTIDGYFFVTNCPYRESKIDTKEKEQSLSPINFFKLVAGSSEASAISGEFKLRLEGLSSSIGIETNELFNVLKKVRLVVGPPLENFDMELSAFHLHSIPPLAEKSLTLINRVRDEFAQKIHNASSLRIEDTYNHIYCQINDGEYDPRVMAKKITLEEFDNFVNSTPKDVFTYFKNSSELDIGSSKDDLNILRKKIVGAGLGSQYESLKRRALSAEEHFLEEANKYPEEFQVMLDQVEGSVLTICSDSILDATNDKKISGIDAFKNARDRLKDIAENHPNQVAFKGPECLIGVAGLLTGACKLWWSEEFDLGDEI